MAKESEIIYGMHAVRHVLQQRPQSILEIWIQDGRTSGREIDQIVRLSEGGQLHVEYVPRATLDWLTDNAVHQGVAIKCRSEIASMPDDIDSILALSADRPRLLLV